jgi:asparagine synthase (glutamine-hydrolysing)
MAWSIETRLPFLDFNVVEFCLSLPHDMKIHRGWSKYLLRRAAEPSLPREVVWRRSKFGFESPENDWLDPLMARMKPEVLACPVLGQLVDPERLSQAFDRLDLRGRWRIFVVARWASLFGVKGVAS